MINHTSVAHLFLHSVDQHRRRPLLVDAVSGQERSYDQVLDGALSWVALLRQRGVGPGDRLAVVLPNSLDFAELYLGAALEGVALCPYNPAMVHEEIAALTARHGCLQLLAQARRVAPLAQATGLPCFAVGRGLQLPPPLARDQLQLPDGDAVMVLVMTSGTTGGARACVLRQRNLCWTAAQSCQALGLDRHSRYLTPLPLFHINPQVIGLLAAITAGGAVAIAPRLPAARLWQAAERCQATGISAVPAMIHDLLASDARPPDCLRYVVCSSAPLPEQDRLTFQQRTGLPLVVCYGLSEAGCYVTYGARSGDAPAQAVGQALGCEVRVVDPHGVPCVPGQPGEVVARGPGIFDGYDGATEATAATLRSGWLHTGDLGQLDADGWLYIQGRLKEMINRGGEKVPPHHVEQVLRACPGVAEAAAFAMPHPRLGEEVAAAVVARPGVELTDDLLWDHCLERLAEFETPKVWFHVDALPRGGTGKVLRVELARRYGAIAPGEDS